MTVHPQRLTRAVRSIFSNGVPCEEHARPSATAGPQRCRRLGQGSAEALVAILALLGFGLMWAGVESLTTVGQAPHRGVTTFSPTPESFAYPDAREAETQSLPSWSSARGELSWPDDEPIQLADSGADRGRRFEQNSAGH
jgi:hypothetical protein